MAGCPDPRGPVTTIDLGRHLLCGIALVQSGRPLGKPEEVVVGNSEAEARRRARTAEGPAMTQTIRAHYDGKVIVPDQPVQLPVGQPLRVHLELAEPSSPRFADFLRFAADLPDAPPDLAVQHDHYLYGSPNR